MTAPATSPAATSWWRTLGRRLGATSTAIAVLAAMLALIALGARQPTAPQSDGRSLDVSVPAGPLTLLCPGAPRLAAAETGDGVAYDPDFSPEPVGALTRLSALAMRRDGHVAPSTPAWAPLGHSPLTAAEVVGVDAALASTSGEFSSVELHAEPVAGQVALLAATTLTRTDAGDLRGLAAAPCVPGAVAHWLVGGSTQIGSSSRLVLANPGLTPATVAVTGWGATGPLELEGVAGLLVPPGEERVVLLDAVAGEQERIALRVDVTGGRVTAVVQDSVLNGLVAGGVDTVASAAEPSTLQLMPGLVLAETGDDPQASAAIVRVANPGDEEAHVRLQLRGPDGDAQVPGVEGQVVDPGTVADISLAGMPAGAYTAVVTADVPVAASARVVRVGELSPDDPSTPFVEHAWVVAAEQFQHGLVTLPGLGESPAVLDSAALVISSVGEPAEVEVRFVAADGAAGRTQSYSVGESATLVLDLLGQGAGQAGVSITSTAPVVAGVLFGVDAGDGELITAVTVQPDPAVEQSIVVRLPGY